MNTRDETKVNSAAEGAGVGKILETAKNQGYLLETGQTARKASIDALKKPRRPVLLRIVELVEAAGVNGMTREEIAIAIDRPVYGLSSLVSALVVDSELFETQTKRLTTRGCKAGVLVHRSFADHVVIPKLPEGGLSNV